LAEKAESEGEGAGTMTGRLENLWKTAAGDGALTPIGTNRPEFEFDALLDAWFRERQVSVECRLYLDEAGQLLRELVGQDTMSSQLRRRVKTLLLAIRALKDAERGTDDDEE
jgi:hypothetical protein